MQERNLCLNLLTENSFIQIPQIFVDYFKEDKDVVFMLTHLLNQYKFLYNAELIDEFEFFFSTVDSIKNKYYISDYSQRRSIKKLEDALFITTIKKGMPAKRYVRINFSVINRVLNGSTKIPKKRDTSAFYTNLNNAIEIGWEDFKKSMDNMNKLPALGIYFWKKIYDRKNNIKWKWDSKLFGIFNSWVLDRKKTGPIDYSYIEDYLNSNIPYSSQEEAMKKFTLWSKNQLEKSPSLRLTDYAQVLSKADEI